tara:strand:- start:2166 stop:2357 length:192 start_codon:yes stop_codon:yes gene_type:complete
MVCSAHVVFLSIYNGFELFPLFVLNSAKKLIEFGVNVCFIPSIPNSHIDGGASCLLLANPAPK